MKLTIEINGDDTKFEYEVGTSRHCANQKITPEILVCFSNILQLASNAYQMAMEKRKDAILHRVADLESKIDQILDTAR